jgi:AraC family transcriptional regulator of adaptative response / DNA-3-methyladenine glycosylase II
MELDRDVCYRAIATRDARFDGRFFTGVKTTGVYCRPVCPARTPKLENVTFFPTAAAAQEAGFRPCLRCRPETAPGCGAWRGTSSTVSCGLSLIELGALDDGNVEALAERLGMGGRQLRRLFQQHVGASPLAVAQTRRILLAKQLIHDTRLPMAEVAMASGFGSIRRFNETFQDLYGRPPGALRRATKGNPGPDGEISILLPYRPPYDWDAILGYLRHRAIPGVESVIDGVFSRTIELGGARGSVSVQQAEGSALRATIRFPRTAMLLTIVERLRRLFDLAADPESISAHLGKDDALGQMVAARPGLRVPGAWDGFETAIRAILGQQITVVAANGLARKLVQTYGEPLRNGEIVNGLTHIFPRPERLAAAELASLGMPRSRGLTLSGLSQAFVRDARLFDARQSLEEAVLRLRAVPGIGEWTAQYIAMRVLREPDAFPAADVALARAMEAAEGRGFLPKELLARAEKWRPWRAYAAQHLWASLHGSPGIVNPSFNANISTSQPAGKIESELPETAVA